jgi:hypothetical protein
MQREFFGLAGGLLDDDGLARCLLLAALAPASVRAWLGASGSVDQIRSELLRRPRDTPPGARTEQLRLRLTTPAGRLRRATPASIVSLRDGLRHSWTDLESTLGGPFELALQDVPAELDGQWLSYAFLRQSRVASVVLERNRPNAPRWDWPLRIAVPPTDEGKRLLDVLADAHFAQLYRLQIATPESTTASPPDLLLLPESLAATPRRSGRDRLHGAAILVVGDADSRPAEAHARLRRLLNDGKAGLAGVCFVPTGERKPWFEALVRELSHNNPLPIALAHARLAGFRHTQAGAAGLRDFAAPLLLGDSAFTASTRIEDAALRLAAAIRRLDVLPPAMEFHPALLSIADGPPTTPAELARALEKRVAGNGWFQELGDATDYVGITTGTQAQTGPFDLRAPVGQPVASRIAPPRAGDVEYEGRVVVARPFPSDSIAIDGRPGPGMSGSEPEPAAAAPLDAGPPRRLQARLTELRAPAPDSMYVIGTMQPDVDYMVWVHIGEKVLAGALTTGQPLDESPLPRAPGGDELTIVYCPLSPARSDDGARRIPAPVQSTLLLRRSGDSAPVTFVARCGEDPARFRARLIVAYRNRILQTLLLTADDAGVPAMNDENFYVDVLAPAAGSEAAQITFVVNDAPDGTPGLATLTPDSLSFTTPKGLDVNEVIGLVLSIANVDAIRKGSPGFADVKTLDKLRALAVHGSALSQELQMRHRMVPFAGLRTVQTVEAVEDATHFPVELLYAGEPPSEQSVLCPNATAALLGDAGVHAGCPHAHDENYLCPAMFWGFHKCIERLPARPPGAETPASVPTAATDRLGPFKRALLAASDNAEEQMKPPDGLPERVGRHVAAVETAASWADWKTKVSGASPDLMVMLPHSLPSKAAGGMAALEVSGGNLLWTSVAAAHVLGPASTVGPLVLLLGCSTALTEVPFLNFVRKFHFAGAAIVVGTLATIHASQSARIASEVLEELADDRRAPLRFDEVLLAVKRRLLADGHVEALSLMSYGHSSWRI